MFKGHTRKQSSSIHSCVLVYIKFFLIVFVLPLLLDELVAICLSEIGILIKYLDAADVFFKSIKKITLKLMSVQCYTISFIRKSSLLEG